MFGKEGSHIWEQTAKDMTEIFLSPVSDCISLTDLHVL